MATTSTKIRAERRIRMARKKNKPSVEETNAEARMLGLTYAEYQQKETLAYANTGFIVPRGYRKAGEKARRGVNGEGKRLSSTN